MVLKTCTKCGQAKPHSEFSRNKNAKDGLQHQCRSCGKAYYEANAVRIRTRAAERARKNPQANRERASEWYAKNRDQALATQAAWRAANKERKAETTAEWEARNLEKVRAIKRKWGRANPEHVNAKTRERRARVRGAQGSHTAADVKELIRVQRCKCAVCRADISETYHVDHIVPLILGGSNDKSNLQLLCPSCNTSKGGKHPVDFMQKRGYLI